MPDAPRYPLPLRTAADPSVANRRYQRALVTVERRVESKKSKSPMAAAVDATDDDGGSVGPLVALPSLHAMFPAVGAGQWRADRHQPQRNLANNPPLSST